MWPECSTNILTWQSSYAHIFFQPFYEKKKCIRSVFKESLCTQCETYVWPVVKGIT